MRGLLFRWLHHLVTGYPRLIVSLSLLLATFLGFYGYLNMEMITDQDRLLSEDLPYHSRYMEFIRNFGDLEFIYVLIEGPTQEEMIAFADALAARLRRSGDVENIIYEFDTAWARDYALLYASLEDLQRLRNELANDEENISQLFSLSSVDPILGQITQSLDSSTRQQQEVDPQMQNQLSALIAAMEGNYQSPFAEFEEFEEQLLEETAQHQYFWSASKNALLMMVMPAKDYSTLSVIERPLKRIRSDLRLTLEDHPAIEAGITGRPALQADEMRTTNEDMQRSSIIAILGVALLFSIFFKELIRPVLAVLTLLIAMAWTYGIVAMTLGHLNLLSTVFALILIGLGIDFGIHFLARYQEELKKDNDSSSAVQRTYNNVGRGLMTGAITSSVAFLLALLTDFQGLAELGYVAGIGVFLCLVAMMITLASFLITYDRHFGKAHRIPEPMHLLGLRHVSRYPWFLMIVIGIATIAFLPRVQNLTFDDNLLNLQAEGIESVIYEHKLMDESEFSSWYAAFIEPSLEAARETAAQLKANPLVSGVDSLTEVLPNPSPEQLQLLSDIHEVLSPAQEYVPVNYRPNQAVYQNLARRLQSFFQQMQQMQEQMQTQIRMQAQSQQSQQSQVQQPQQMQQDSMGMVESLQRLLALLTGPREQVESRLERANETLIQEPKRVLYQLWDLSGKREVPLDGLPEVFETLYIGENGSILVMAYPTKNIWEHDNIKEFVQAIREIDPEVTGTPVQVYESSLLMRYSFRNIGLLSLVAVAVLVFLDFRSIKSTLTVIMPLLLGVLWLVELMGIFNIPLNLANFFAIPILVGIGVDNAVHLYHRYQETKDVDKCVYTTGSTLTLTSLTTSVGFGSLILASHRGLSSLGLLMAVGTATCWFACVIFMPTLIKVLQGKQNEQPLD